MIKKYCLCLFFMFSSVAYGGLLPLPRDFFPRSIEDNHVETVGLLDLPLGTAEGEILYWDAALGFWVASDVTKLKWTAATDTLLANTFTDGTASLSGGTLTLLASHTIKGGASGDIDYTAPTSHDFIIGSTEQIFLIDGVLGPATDNDIDLGISGSADFKDGYFQGTLTAGGITSLDGDILIQRRDNVAAQLMLDAATGKVAQVQFEENGVLNWVMRSDPCDGSDLTFRRFDDLGDPCDVPLTIDGTTGNVTVLHDLSATDITASGLLTVEGHAVSLGSTVSDVDVIITFHGNTFTGTLTYEPDQSRFDFGDSRILTTGNIGVGAIVATGLIIGDLGIGDGTIADPTGIAFSNTDFTGVGAIGCASLTATGTGTFGAGIFDITSTEALLVRQDADAKDIFIVDTTNGRTSLFQNADGGIVGTASDEGLRVFGHDDKNSDYIQLVVDELGYSALRASQLIYIAPNGIPIGVFTQTFFQFFDNKVFRFGSLTADWAGLDFSTIQTNNALLLTTSNDSKTLVICETADIGVNFGHPAQANPTIFVHSADATDTTQWLSLAHNQTNGVIEIGTGYLDLPATNIGDGTNEIQFASDGYKIMVGDARVKEHFIESATLAGIGIGSGNAAAANARNNTAVVTYASGGSQPKEAFFIFHIPDNMDITEDLEVHIHWAPTTTAVGNVNWQMDWLAMESENNELINAAATTANVVDAAQTTAFELLETDNMIISAASISLEDTISIRIFRDAGTAPDTYGAAADLVLVEFEYIKDKDGEHL